MQTIAHRQAVVELMQRTRRLMDGTGGGGSPGVRLRPVLYPEIAEDVEENAVETAIT